MSDRGEEESTPPAAPTPPSRGRWRLWPAFPHPHFMGLAPLDVWARMLLRGGAWRRLGGRYAVRLAWCVFTSALATVVTLPERVVFAMAWGVRRARRAAPVDQGPIVVCVLGYFRSGTTHLHYLLSCDPASVTPRWYQCLAPQGWWVSWALLRWFLVPFLGSTRPQDDVAIGPEWPAEDDFALCNWSLSSSMPGRMVLPREWEDGQRGWRRMHALEGVAEGEVSRWRDRVRAFAWKVSAGGGAERILLKNPSHTARVRELVRAFGADRVRFIHIAREADAVVRSNVAMHRRFGPYVLQDLPDEPELRRRIIEEYDQTERRFLEQSAELPPGSLARMRYQDLIADPVGELKRVYGEMGWAWSSALDERAAKYLGEVAGYRAGAKRHDPRPESPPAAETTELAWMHRAFGHDRPARATVVVRGAEAAERRGVLAGLIDPLITSLLGAAVWTGAAWVMRDRLDWLVWPVGVAIGLVTLRTRRGTGSVAVGMWAGTLTLLAMAAAAYPATALAFYRGRAPMPWDHVWLSTRDGLMAINNLVWLFLGVVSAYRLASRKQASPPGE